MENPDELTFRADLLREEMRKAKLSQNKVAGLMGISTKTMSSKMNGYNDWNLKEIQELQNILPDMGICTVFNLKGGEKMMCKLKEYSTAQLAEELRSREGVDTKIAEPYETLNNEVKGPATVLIIVD